MKENQLVLSCIRSSSPKILNIRYLYLSTSHWEAASNTVYSANHSLYIWFGITEQTNSGQKLQIKAKAKSLMLNSPMEKIVHCISVFLFFFPFY